MITAIKTAVAAADNASECMKTLPLAHGECPCITCGQSIRLTANGTYAIA